MQIEDVANGSLDKICCMCCSDKYLVIGRESGIIQQYDVLLLRLEAKEFLQCRPQGRYLVGYSFINVSHDYSLNYVMQLFLGLL